MKIKNRLYLSAGISIVLIIALISTIFITANQIAKKDERREMADELHQSISELDIITFEYLMYGEERMEVQWNSKYNSTENVLETAEGDLNHVHKRFILLGDLFLQVNKNYEKKQKLIQNEAPEEELENIIDLEERLTTKLLITSQSLISDIFKYSEKKKNEIKQAREMTDDFILFLVIILTVTIIVTSSLTARSIIKPLVKLIKGAETIGKGNLKHKIEVKQKDEMGVLAHSFNEMTSKLRGYYSELENEVEERKQAEEKVKKAYERLKELDKLKDDFLSVTTHELKTPLIPIKAQSEMLLAGDHGKLNKDQIEAVDMILRNEEQLLRLVNDVLDITKVESKKLKLEFEEVSLGAVVVEAVKDMELLAGKLGISIALKPVPKLPTATVDKKRIIQVLQNLLGNAIKFSPDGGTVEVEVRKTETDIEVKVTDHGIGMGVETLEQLFTPFFQASRDVKRRYGGTGLGLSICKGIAEAHGGNIRAESDGEGKGSVFTLSVPIKANLTDN